MNAKMLPFAPEPVEALRLRLPAALEEPFDDESVKLGSQTAPDLLRRNVLDFEDGIRFVMYRCRGKTYLSTMPVLGGRMLTEALGNLSWVCPDFGKLTHVFLTCPACLDALAKDPARCMSEPRVRVQESILALWERLSPGRGRLKLLGETLLGLCAYQVEENE